MANEFEKRPLSEEESLDELIRSTREEIRRCDELMGEKKPETQTRKEPAFQPELPREYAELTVERKKRKLRPPPESFPSERRPLSMWPVSF